MYLNRLEIARHAMYHWLKKLLVRRLLRRRKDNHRKNLLLLKILRPNFILTAKSPFIFLNGFFYYAAPVAAV